MAERNNTHGLYDHSLDKDSCGVGFITRKSGEQTHDVLRKAHEALCTIPHRGGMSAEGVGDGAGVNVDLPVHFFRKVTGDFDLKEGDFGVANFFYPKDAAHNVNAQNLIDKSLHDQGLKVILHRDVPVEESAVRPAALKYLQRIRQFVFLRPEGASDRAFDKAIYEAQLAVESEAYYRDDLAGLSPLSMSARTMVYKGRLNSNEVIPYFKDLGDKDFAIRSLFFHTRFSTNTEPQSATAQPFHTLAHNGELNTDKKNRLSEAAIAHMNQRRIYAPKGQSDSARLDQTVQRRLIEDDMDLVTAIVAMMPPAWENDSRMSEDVRVMLEYFSLYEEKNDGPAAVIFGDGKVVGARLDRLGLRPLRSVETEDYLCVMSEAGQIDFPPESVLRRGRIEAGGMIVYDHVRKRSYDSVEALEMLAKKQNYRRLLEDARINLSDLPVADRPGVHKGDFNDAQRWVAYSLNQESFRFMMDPMLAGGERISAMGYGVAINALTDLEGGMAKYFSQRFAQVTNPPLDSIREADGMTLRVALGARPHFNQGPTKQIVIPTPILSSIDLATIRQQNDVPVAEVPIIYPIDHGADAKTQQAQMIEVVEKICDDIATIAKAQGGIIILSDSGIDSAHAPVPLLLIIAAANQRLIDRGLRFRVSLIAESGQIASSHQIATALGFGASAVMPISVELRARSQNGQKADQIKAMKAFIKAANKSLMKTMGKVGLCTAESYIGGEFFEPNFFDTNDGPLAKYFPNMVSPVGGVGFAEVVHSNAEWHKMALTVTDENSIPLLGLFKERSEGAGHSYGNTAVRGFTEMTEEEIAAPDGKNTADEADADVMRLMTISKLDDAYGMGADSYRTTSFEKRTPEQIDNFKMTPAYKSFIQMMDKERAKRPAALRDVLAFPAEVNWIRTAEEFTKELFRHDLVGNDSFLVRGLSSERDGEYFKLTLIAQKGVKEKRILALQAALEAKFGDELSDPSIEGVTLRVKATGMAESYFSRIVPAQPSIDVAEVQPASEITQTIASGAMSHGALVAPAHEAVAHGTNMVGGYSNSGEGGEHFSRYNTIRASRIKQLASGRFGVWTGYLADPMLEELEIKIAQGAKPGEGGQLPGAKVDVEIAAARGGTPGVELISPPPHHDTYSIEDLGQLIHDAKAARVRVIVKLVSSEGIGTIAVGVAKAGADVINVAGNTGGTGAAAVTSLKNSGRSAEIGLAEVHQALCANGLREKVILRCSGAHQTGSDLVKSALLGGDSFEFGTTALMMLKCVMAKNCNIKCPAGLTTNAEAFEGDPRALAQYLMNLAHEVRYILAKLGFKSLREARGRSDYLHLLKHKNAVGQLDLRDMLKVVPEVKVENPVYLEKNFDVDDMLLAEFKKQVIEGKAERAVLADGLKLNNRNKTVGGQLSIDIERMLQWELSADEVNALPAAYIDDRGRRMLKQESVVVKTTGSAGQSYAAFNNLGIIMDHTGTCNDGVGKAATGGIIVIHSPGGGTDENYLVGNFALFGATGSRLFVEGGAGDRFGVRNSGATAVVEGVGDFCAEYMTNGAILNLGEFGKGFCNGMSGGVAYQYDPYNQLSKLYSADSVKLHDLDGDNDRAALHRQAVKLLLERHVHWTGSAKAQFILDNWDEEVRHFRFATPLALETYQNYEAILKANTRKDLVDELAKALVGYQIRKFKLAYRDGLPIADGKIPTMGGDANLINVLVNNYAVQNMAEQIVRGRYKNMPEPTDAQLNEGIRKLILTEDFTLVQRLASFAKKALEGFADLEIAVLISDKRIRDYKTALANRNNLLQESFGTHGWIIMQDRINREAMGTIPDFEALFATASAREMVKLMSAQNV